MFKSLHPNTCHSWRETSTAAHLQQVMKQIIAKHYFLTSRILWTDKDVRCLGQPLHELSNALRVILGLAQRAHHGAQDTADNAWEQFWVERVCCCRLVRHGIRPCAVSWSSTRRRLRWREDWLGLKMKCRYVVAICQKHYRSTNT